MNVRLSPIDRPFLRVALAALTVQLLFWFLVSPLLTPTRRPLERLPQTGFAVSAPESPEWQRVANASFEDQASPWTDCCGPGYRAVRVRFELDSVPDEGLAEVPVIGADNYETRVNGVLLFSHGRMHLPDASYHGRAYRGINRIPAAALRVGTNEMVYTLVRHRGGGEFFAARPTLGLFGPTESHFAFRRFLLNEYQWLSIVIGGLTGLLAGVAWLRGGRQAYLFWLALLAVAWAGTLYHLKLTDPLLVGRPLTAAWVVLSLLVPLAWANLLNVWSGRCMRWVLPVTALFGAVALGIAVWDIARDGGQRAEQVISFYSALLAFVCVGLLARALSRLSLERAWEFAIFLLCVTILVRDALGQLAGLPNWGASTELVLPLLLVALMVSFLARNVRLFRSREELSEVLARQLAERTAALEAAHRRERELVRREALEEERQRIMRDMHDGLGSNLMSMLVAARRGIADPEQVAEGIQSAIDEMRLMIDSMDSVGESLRSALVVFRERTRARLQAAGIELEWQQAEAVLDTRLGPRDVLQVFRILQEAVTNVLKHAEARHVRVEIVDEESLTISVCDDGRGFDAGATSAGRGLVNLGARARSIGASVDVSASDAGTCVRFSLPRRGGGPVDEVSP